MCVFSPVQAKSKTGQCECAFKYHSRAQKRERECYNYVCVQFSVGLCQCIHVLVCVCVCQGVPICVTVSMCRWGSVVCLCVEGPGCSPDFSWELQWSMSSAEKQQEQATYKLNGHNLKTSTFTLASSSMSSRAIKQAIDTYISCLAVNQNRKYKVFLGSSEFLLLSDELCVCVYI